MQDLTYLLAEIHEVPIHSFLQLPKAPLSSSSAFQQNDYSNCKVNKSVLSLIIWNVNEDF